MPGRLLLRLVPLFAAILLGMVLGCSNATPVPVVNVQATMGAAVEATATAASSPTNTPKPTPTVILTPAPTLTPSATPTASATPTTVPTIVSRSTPTVVSTPVFDTPDAPESIGYGQAFTVDGFYVVVEAPEAYDSRVNNLFNDATHRVRIVLINQRDMSQYVPTIQAGINGVLVRPTFLCADCPGVLDILFVEALPGANLQGYLYFNGQPSQIHVESGLLGQNTTIVNGSAATGVETAQPTVVPPTVPDIPDAPKSIGYGQAFTVDGFYVVVEAPEAYDSRVHNPFNDATRRVRIVLINQRDMSQYVPTIQAGINGVLVRPTFLCADCPGVLDILFVEALPGANLQGYLYFNGQPSQIHVESGLLGQNTTIVNGSAATGVETAQPTVVPPTVPDIPDAPKSIGYGQAFTVDGFYVVVEAPEAYDSRVHNPFNDATRRVRIVLINQRDMSQYVPTIQAGINGVLVRPTFLCADCPDVLDILFVEALPGANLQGYLYFNGQPSQIHVESGLLGQNTTIVK